MWKKVTFAVVLVAFLGVQLASSLSCYSCNSPSACRSPSTQTCTNATANANKDFLGTYHSNVPTVNGSLSFLCANLTYYHQANNSHTSEFLGCVHPGTNVCTLTLSNSTQQGTWARRCNTCNTDYCNPAGTFSGSLFTIVGSVIALLLAKAISH
ncbi:uncharacterized protein [Drosophila bipectinata]|uniref:uncharacterized protein n=1 Tax=Drosophila bipectinata TaxID=42026 RepID=UPI001C893423|nr:uncharacterized protein LOC108124356 [Drosophila bipectinata]